MEGAEDEQQKYHAEQPTVQKQTKKDKKPVERWTEEEHLWFLSALRQYGKDWRLIAEIVSTKDNTQCKTHGENMAKQLKKLKGKLTELDIYLMKDCELIEQKYARLSGPNAEHTRSERKPKDKSQASGRQRGQANSSEDQMPNDGQQPLECREEFKLGDSLVFGEGEREKRGHLGSSLLESDDDDVPVEVESDPVKEVPCFKAPQNLQPTTQKEVTKPAQPRTTKIGPI